jgi:hypothetical protein
VNAPELCTTAARLKRHYSTVLAADRHAPRRPGRAGRTLCGQRGCDEERANAPSKVYDEYGRHWSMVPPRTLVRVADLPPCARCVKTLAAM